MHLTLVMPHNGLDVFDHALAQYLLRGGRSSIAVGKHPVGCLRMPHQAVADDLQVVLLAVVDKLVGHTEVEDALSGCEHLALHAVLRHGAIEMTVDDGICLWHLPIALPLVDGRTDEEIFAHGILQTLSHGCQWHHGQAQRKYLDVFTHCGVLQFPY